MNQFKDFFFGLFNTDKWPPRWKCGTWSDFQGWLYIISDLSIWIAYFLIPVIIINYLSKKKGSLKFNKTYIYFAAFIVLCGATHFLDAMMFWIPMYRLNTLVRFATAVISIFTVYHLFKILPLAFAQKTNVELEDEIVRRQQAEEKLEEVNGRLENFAAAASHDLQEPLRKIKIFSEMLSENNKTSFDQKSRQQMDKIINASDRMQLLIQDILMLSSIKEEIGLTDIDPGKAIQKALDDLEIKIKQKNAVISIGNLPVIQGNEIYLTQLFLNLLSNALKFTNEQPLIEITGEKTGESVRIQVKDNGIGISDINYLKIFDAFQRLHPKSSYEGTGVGLTICKNIMKAHQGSIEVISSPGNGTAFLLFFKSGKE